MARLIDITGKALSGEWGDDDLTGEGIPVLRTTNFTNDGVVNYANVVTRDLSKKDVSKKYLCPGDIILEKSGGSDNQPVGRVIYFDGPKSTYLFNNFTGVLRVSDTHTWISRYIFYALFANYHFGGTRRFENRTTGLHNLQTDAYIASVEIKDFPVEKQQKIVNILDKLSNLISLRKQQLAKLDELVKARFVEMFGRPGTACNQWPIVLLGNCCILNPKKSVEPNLISGLTVSFVPMPSVSEDGNMDVSEVRVYDDVKTGFTYFAENDVLFAKITPCMENGKGAIAQNLQNGIGFGSTEFHVLRPIEGKSNPYWLYTITSFKQFRVDAQANMTGSAGQRRVPASYLESYKIALPPIELQDQFASFCKYVRKQKLTIQQSLDKLEVLKKSLMQEFFG